MRTTRLPAAMLLLTVGALLWGRPAAAQQQGGPDPNEAGVTETADLPEVAEPREPPEGVADPEDAAVAEPTEPEDAPVDPGAATPATDPGSCAPAEAEAEAEAPEAPDAPDQNSGDLPEPPEAADGKDPACPPAATEEDEGNEAPASDDPPATVDAGEAASAAPRRQVAVVPAAPPPAASPLVAGAMRTRNGPARRATGDATPSGGASTGAGGAVGVGGTAGFLLAGLLGCAALVAGAVAGGRHAVAHPRSIDRT